MNINAKISLFKHYMDTTPVCEMTIFQFYENVVDCDYVNEVTAIRSIDEKKRRDEIKATLPCVTISGTFTKRGNQHLKHHSGFICVDIDATDNPNITDWEGLRDTLGAWNDVLMAALSVSGRGVFLLVPIAYPSRHKQHFLALEKDFAALGLTIDKACKDIARLRLISSDPRATWNPNAKQYRKVVIEPKTYHSKPAGATPELSKLIDWTERKYGSFVNGNRNHFVTQLAGAAHRFNVSQAEVVNYCRTLAEKDFSENGIMKTIQSIYNNQQWKGKAKP